MMKIVCFIFPLLLIFGVGEDSMARTRFDVDIHFFERPIPQKVYEANKNIQTWSYDPESFFMAKIQVIGSPVGERGSYKALVQVIEVLSGRIPGEQFIVHYLAAPPYAAGLPDNHESDKFYFIMGVRIDDGNIQLISASVGQVSKNGYLNE